jgi:hypothetical protein
VKGFLLLFVVTICVLFSVIKKKTIAKSKKDLSTVFRSSGELRALCVPFWLLFWDGWHNSMIRNDTFKLSRRQNVLCWWPYWSVYASTDVLNCWCIGCVNVLNCELMIVRVCWCVDVLMVVLMSVLMCWCVRVDDCVEVLMWLVEKKSLFPHKKLNKKKVFFHT